MNYYNEWDKPTAAWLRELVAQGLIPKGEVDERSITEVQPADLRGYTQCHFFAGIGGWPYALQLAGWSSDRPVWTGSCPCQPYSVAGKREGDKDERHLWPEMFRLIRECKPKHVFGEQVTGAIGHGWLDGVSADLEAEGYAVGAVVLGAHSVGAPHIRQRLYWVADNNEYRRDEGVQSVQAWQAERVGGDSINGWMGNTDNKGPQEFRRSGNLYLRQQNRTDSGRQYINASVSSGLPDTECSRHQPQQDAGHSSVQSAMVGEKESRVTTGAHGSGFRGIPDTDQRAISRGSESQPGEARQQVAQQGHGPDSSNHTDNRNEVGAYWSEFDTIPFLDGKARRIEPGTFPLAHGLPARVVRLRGYGNAIVPQCAQAFIESYMEIQG